MRVVRKITLGAVALVTAVGGSVLVAGPAAAHEGSHKFTFLLDCGEAGEFLVESNGNGAFTSARDVNSTRVLVPVAFGDFTGTFTDAEGNVETFTEPGATKGSGKQKSNATCIFEISESFPDGATFTGSGSATVKITKG